MANVSDPRIRQWVEQLKDDADPLSWFVLSYGKGKEEICPVASGEGEADDYWDDLLGMMKDDATIFALARIVMGDAESHRPKFCFITWLGASCGMMQKARVGMHKGDVKKVIGAFHCEMQVDAKDELALPDVKVKLKKSMGADYDMGSNSRGADGAQGNAGSAFAPTEYKSQQSEIKKKAAAAYDGGDRVKVSGGIASLGAAGQSQGHAVHMVQQAAETVVGQYTCVKKSQCRLGFEMDSEKASVISVGQQIEALQ
eukprot:SAG22_NODE_1367_length_4592_cov_15.327436_6_plen_255_part_01